MNELGFHWVWQYDCSKLRNVPSSYTRRYDAAWSADFDTCENNLVCKQNFKLQQGYMDAQRPVIWPINGNGRVPEFHDCIQCTVTWCTSQYSEDLVDVFMKVHMWMTWSDKGWENESAHWLSQHTFEQIWHVHYTTQTWYLMYVLTTIMVERKFDSDILAWGMQLMLPTLVMLAL